MKTRFILKVLLAIIIGEILLILLTTVAQEILVDGVSLETSSNSELILGGGATLLAGVISGFVASLLVGKRVKVPHYVISLLIGVETAYLIISNKVGGPLWFDIISALLLIASVWVGYYLYLSFKRD